ncbi:LysR family transcriptional regulator [Shinella daejeonensis]|uniref:LysR family transcriptional regulator n=1 Tax=Shinella daejeonensis TaxID=659017 RepID=UPI0020C76CD1|nr:LysR family transcriptional regulator [Shinella daejeonensis]MCP8893719.1 LysR family transcriptional regulator [Shinella daejeonensis]
MSLLTRPALPLLELDVLKTFVAIAETGNFTTAAGAVHRTPSAVSMQIKKLEDQLGCVLFRRDARSVTLTHHGEMLLSYARRLLALSNEAVSRFMMPEMSGIVRLGAPDDVGELILPDVLKRFAETYPSIAVNVSIGSSSDLRRGVAERRLDLAVFNAADGAVPAAGEILMREQLVWAGRRCGTAHLKRPLPISIWEEGCIWRARALEELSRSSREFRIAYFCAHHMGQRAAIRADLAVAPLARFLVGEDMVALGEKDGLPDLGHYQIGQVVAERADAPALAVADYIRAAFARIEQRPMEALPVAC